MPEMKLYVADRNFLLPNAQGLAVGGFDVAKGSLIGFNGTHISYDGVVRVCPYFNAAIRNDWVIPCPLILEPRGRTSWERLLSEEL